MDNILFGLLSRGYFPKELPPAFNTYKYALKIEEYPINSAALELLQIIPGTGVATLRCRLTLTDNNVHPERWHLSARIQLAAPGVWAVTQARCAAACL